MAAETQATGTEGGGTRALAAGAKPERMPCWPDPVPGPGRGRLHGPALPASENPMPDMNPVVRWFHQLGSPPYFDRFAARWSPWGYLVGALAMAWGVYGALFQVPPDYQQGDSFRILYI